MQYGANCGFRRPLLEGATRFGRVECSESQRRRVPRGTAVGGRPDPCRLCICGFDHLNQRSDRSRIAELVKRSSDIHVHAEAADVVGQDSQQVIEKPVGLAAGQDVAHCS